MAVYSLEEITLSPQEIRSMLNVDDNEEIINLCKKVSIVPKRNNRGLTYFTYNEFKMLQKAKEMKNNLVRITPDEFMNKLSGKILEEVDDRIDDKLKGIEEIVAELLEYQTENAKLKNKIVEINKENVFLKSELKNYKKIGLGFFRKEEIKDFSI